MRGPYIPLLDTQLDLVRSRPQIVADAMRFIEPASNAIDATEEPLARVAAGFGAAPVEFREVDDANVGVAVAGMDATDDRWADSRAALAQNIASERALLGEAAPVIGGESPPPPAPRTPPPRTRVNLAGELARARARED